MLIGRRGVGGFVLVGLGWVVFVGDGEFGFVFGGVC